MCLFFFSEWNSGGDLNHAWELLGRIDFVEVDEREGEPHSSQANHPKEEISAATLAFSSIVNNDLSYHSRKKYGHTHPFPSSHSCTFGWEWPSSLLHIPLQCLILGLKDGECSEERNEGIRGWKIWGKEWDQLEVFRLQTEWSRWRITHILKASCSVPSACHWVISGNSQRCLICACDQSPHPLFGSLV